MLDADAIFQKLIDTHLPLVPHLETICSVLNESGAAIVRSDPGSGKSTLVPLALLAHAESVHGNDTEKGAVNPAMPKMGRILMLEGRRAAALGIASRMAELLGEEPGERVGYAVRLQRKVSSRTRIEVLTEGLLVRRLQGDPDLAGVSTVIFDEFHERSIHTDLALALLLDLRRLGAPVRLLIMSATMDARKIADFIDAAENRTGSSSGSGGRVPVIDCPGRVFPVDIRYWPVPGRAPIGRESVLVLGEILKEESTKKGAASGQGKSGLLPLQNILVFLPGKREIEDATSCLQEGGFARDFDILPLHGSLPLARQREVLLPPKSARRRIILATNLAETGLTVPGVNLVVDSGYVRLERYHLPTAMNRLSLEAASGNSADQRAGRAGRLMPGQCVRLWEESMVRPKETEYEIRRVDLSGLVLECLLWGARKRTDLPWPEPPPEAAWSAAVDLLQLLGAVDDALNPTERGRTIARLGLEVRLGCLCIAGQEAGQPALACAAAAILSDPAKFPQNGPGTSADADFASRLQMFRLHPGQAWTRGIAETTADLLHRLGSTGDDIGGITGEAWDERDEADIGELLAAGFPDRIAARQESGMFRFISGREARIEGSLANSEWLVAADVDAGERSGYIRLAAPLSKEGAMKILAGRIQRETQIEWQGLIPKSALVTSAGRLTISREQRPGVREAVIRDLPRLLETQGLAILPWEDDEGKGLLERIRFFMAHSAHVAGVRSGTGTAEAWTDEVLIQDAAEWLGPFVWEGRETGKGPIIDGRGLCDALNARLGWMLKQELDNSVPRSFSLPKGRKRTIEYASGEPVLAVRLRDAFDIPTVSNIMGVPMVFQLLSPADRPIQTTRDLAGFWKGSYAEVRKEMRGRYPKHNWPAI